jgi:hypothetical protein
MRLLQNTSRGIGDLILIYKRMTGLAGHTSRVAELLEQVRGGCVRAHQQHNCLKRTYNQSLSCAA